MRKFLSLSAATLTLAAGGVLATTALAGSADAATGTCAGSRIEHIGLRSGAGRTIGYLDIYYNKKSGYNCARTVTISSVRGKVKLMGVGLRTCSKAGSGCSHAGKAREDVGKYQSYAGPVKVYGKGRCIQAAGAIELKSTEYAHKTTRSFHCG